MTKRLAIVLLALAVLLLGLLAVAKADARPFDATAQTYYREALAHWHRPPTCSPVTTEIVGADAFARAGDPEALGMTFDDPGECAVWIADFGTPCLEKEAVFHEVGHLVGLEHSSNPLAIMSGEPIGEGPFCRRARARMERRRLHHARPISWR